MMLHADRTRELRAGQSLSLVSPDIPGHPELAEFYRQRFPLGVSRHGERYLLAATHDLALIAAGQIDQAGVQHRANAEIEIILELVRLEIAPSAPSRYSSTFASGSLSDVRRMATELNWTDYNVVEIDKAGGIRVDMHWLKQGSPVTMWRHAEGYWRQEPFDDNPMWEQLIPLPATVAKVHH